jgi:TonB family protein
MKTQLISAGLLTAALSVFAPTAVFAGCQDAKPVSQAAPSYSHDLRASGIEGEVVVGFTISATGEVSDAVVVSSTDRALERPTLAAVRKWKFTPAMKDGVAVSIKAVQPVAFLISELHPEANTLATSKPRPVSDVLKTTSAL